MRDRSGRVKKNSSARGLREESARRRMGHSFRKAPVGLHCVEAFFGVARTTLASPCLAVMTGVGSVGTALYVEWLFLGSLGSFASWTLTCMSTAGGHQLVACSPARGDVPTSSFGDFPVQL